MKSYFMKFENDEEGNEFVYFLKVESAKSFKTMKAYVIEAVREKAEREKSKMEKQKDDK